MSRKKILYIQHSGASGGAPMSLFYLLEYVRLRHDIVVYFIADGPAVKFYRDKGITTHVATRLSKFPHCTIEYQSLNPFTAKYYHDLRAYLRHVWKFFGSYAEMRAIIEREHPDIVHLNSSVLLSEGLAAKRANVPVVWHLRDFLERGAIGLRRYVASEIIKRCAARIVALCESEACRVGQSSKMVVIPNFVDLEKFNAQRVNPVGLRAAFGWPDDVPVIAMLGWSIPAKGAMVAIEAMPAVLARHPNTKLLLFGPGVPPEGSGARGYGVYRNIARRVKELNIEHAVQFAGTVFNVADYIAEVDVIAAPFVVPHFARPILEAGAMRKIVVTSDLDGTREMVLDGEAGYLARPGNAEDLGARMIEALENNNSERIERMYQNVVENYNAARNAERTMALYEGL